MRFLPQIRGVEAQAGIGMKDFGPGKPPCSETVQVVLVWRILTRRKALRTAPPVAALSQRGVESLFPTDVVDGPEDLRFVSCGET